MMNPKTIADTAESIFINILSSIPTVTIDRKGNKSTVSKLSIVPVYEGVVTSGNGRYINKIYEFSGITATYGYMRIKIYVLKNVHVDNPEFIVCKMFQLENAIKRNLIHEVRLVAYDKNNNPIDVVYQHVEKLSLRPYISERTLIKLKNYTSAEVYDELAPKDDLAPKDERNVNEIEQCEYNLNEDIHDTSEYDYSDE